LFLFEEDFVPIWEDSISFYRHLGHRCYQCWVIFKNIEILNINVPILPYRYENPYDLFLVRSVSLSHSSIPYEGLAQITTGTGKKSVCFQSLDRRATSVMCNNLGYDRGTSDVAKQPPEDAKKSLFPEIISCKGGEKYLSQCSINASAPTDCPGLSNMHCTFGKIAWPTLKRHNIFLALYNISQPNFAILLNL
jgi:hypothetical protein